jgi:hypothetical protein
MLQGRGHQFWEGFGGSLPGTAASSTDNHLTTATLTLLDRNERQVMLDSLEEIRHDIQGLMSEAANEYDEKVEQVMKEISR